MTDLLTILARLHWLTPWVRRKYPFTPVPWKRCHCGALSEIYISGCHWCMPCKYAGHDTCECSQEVES